MKPNKKLIEALPTNERISQLLEAVEFLAGSKDKLKDCTGKAHREVISAFIMWFDLFNSCLRETVAGNSDIVLALVEKRNEADEYLRSIVEGLIKSREITNVDLLVVSISDSLKRVHNDFMDHLAGAALADITGSKPVLKENNGKITATINIVS